MIRTITHIVEPVRLLLTWQAIGTKDRRRYVVGDLFRADNVVVLRYSLESDDFVRALDDGFVGYTAFPKSRRLYDTGVLDAFLRRIPPRSRPDFSDYLEQYRLPAPWIHSDFALIGYTSASLPSDGFALVHTFEGHAGPFEFLTEVAGVSHNIPPGYSITAGSRVFARSEPKNPFDASAVEWILGDQRIGYAPKGLSHAICNWLGAGRTIDAYIDRVQNFQGRAAVRLFIQVSGECKS